ncbi:MAG: MFS transporter [Phycisphaeraceae bacterium]
MSTSSSGIQGDAAAANLPGSAASSGLFYGWVMLPLATLALIASSPAQTFGVSAFNEPFRTSLGLSLSQLTGAYMFGTLLASLPMGYIGALMDRHGLRATLLVVVTLFGGVCILTSQVQGVVSLFFSFLFLRMLGQGALGMLSGNALAFWFERRLGTVEGLRHVGMAGAIAFMPALNIWLIHQFGWRWAYVLLGLTVWAVMLPALLFLWRDRPEEMGQHKDGLPPQAGDRDAVETAEQEARTSLTLREALATRAYWIIMACSAVWSMLGTALLFNVLPLFTSRGLGGADAAWLFTIFALSLAVMHVVGGLLADRLPLNVLLAFGVAALAGAMGMAWQINSPMWVYPLGGLLGLSQGLMVAAGSPIWPRYFGRAYMGRIRGTAATVLVAASSVGPFIMGAGYDLLGSYDQVMLLFALLPVPLCLLALIATTPAKRRARLAAMAAAPA